MPIQHWSEKIWIAQLGNEPTFSEDLSLLTEQFKQCESPPNVIVDLAATSLINSSQLSFLLRLRKLTIDGDTDLRLTKPSREAWASFCLTGLDKLFLFSADVTNALAELQMDP